jgi:hypothetical protein
MNASAAGSAVLLIVSPFIAWAFYGAGLFIDKLAGRKVVNGASIYNWLTLCLVVLAALASRPEHVGRLLVAFSLSWFVGRALSKKYKAMTPNPAFQRTASGGR